MQGVDLVVPQADLAPRGGVAADERLERVGEHVAGQPGHLDDLGLRRDRSGPRQPLGALGDVDGVVAHPLEVVGDLEGRGQHPEVAGHRLLEGEEVDGLPLASFFVVKPTQSEAIGHACFEIGDRAAPL